MKLDSSDCLNITNLNELNLFINEYESLLINISYFHSKIQTATNNNNIEYSMMTRNESDSNDTIIRNMIESTNTENSLVMIQIIKILLYLIMILVGLAGNLLIIIVILLNKFMKNPTNYFILNFALCDLSILFRYYFLVLSFFSKNSFIFEIFSCVWIQIFLVLNENWILGELFCKVNSYMQMVSLIASVLSLSAVSCNRYFGIMYPLKAKTDDGKSYLYIIPIIWAISLIVSLPSFIYRTYREVKCMYNLNF